ncbi:MAG: NDP-hexose 2,3-dehydratase family protein [Clostridiales bacterium]|nr:NDP-hexose 2,3-dehydratase family protein [Clostridiales bacterium]
MSLAYELIKSWKCKEGNVTSTQTILDWVDKRNKTLTVDIEKRAFPKEEDSFWFFDPKDGFIRNRKNTFFQLAGFRQMENGQVVCEQPVIIQDEIGYLGIICKVIDGTLNFLMQAKVEPGNINVIQISPTIQATKSNFTQSHGGKAPAYLDFFAHARDYEIVVDQIQSEQSSRFLRKRNRNILINVGDSEVEVLDSHKWMTLGQIKELMKIDNLVNMDSRTVLSCIPYSIMTLEDGEYEKIEELFDDKALFRSMFESAENVLPKIFNTINNYKMYSDLKHELIPLSELSNWEINENEIICKSPYDFKIVYCQIEIEGREVRCWEQPLVEAIGMAVFGLFTTVKDGCRYFLVKAKPEVGCFDGIELGPVVQMEPSNPGNHLDSVETLFMEKLGKGEGVLKDVILSEEGGRFYHEQNRNAIIEIGQDELSDLPEGYFWVRFSTLNKMVQFNNFLNIQLRNLTSLLDI